MIDHKIVKEMVARLKEHGATEDLLHGFGFESESMKEYENRGGEKADLKALAMEIRREFRRAK